MKKFFVILLAAFVVMAATLPGLAAPARRQAPGPARPQNPGPVQQHRPDPAQQQSPAPAQQQKPGPAPADNRPLVWNGEPDKAVAAQVKEVQNNTRKNASGPKITSNAHSSDFPDIYFIWDSKQKDNGYLKVRQSVFEKYERFTLTTKEANTYWDFPIAPQSGQRRTSDGCYVFYIPKVYNNKNINMVFVSEFVERKRDFDYKKDDRKIERDQGREQDKRREHDKGREQDKKREDDKKRNNDKKRDDAKKKK